MTHPPVGTPVHAVVGVDTTFEVVALPDGGPVLHRRDLPPAEVGAATDVVPLSSDDVTGVALRSKHDGTTELGRLDGAAVDVTAEQLRAAEVGLPRPEFTGPRVFVALERNPLPALVLVVDVESGITTEGLRLPDELLSTLRATSHDPPAGDPLTGDRPRVRCMPSARTPRCTWSGRPRVLGPTSRALPARCSCLSARFHRKVRHIVDTTGSYSYICSSQWDSV